jgi:TolB-like protein
MSSEKDQEYMSDGIAEELLNLLSKVPDLKVIARTSSFAFKGERIEIAEIAKKLNVAHVLEGSVRKSGDKVRITAQLIRAADSSHLWSETYDRALDDIFAIQDEIAGAIVQALELSAEWETEAPARRYPESGGVRAISARVEWRGLVYRIVLGRCGKVSRTRSRFQHGMVNVGVGQLGQG